MGSRRRKPRFSLANRRRVQPRGINFTDPDAYLEDQIHYWTERLKHMTPTERRTELLRQWQELTAARALAIAGNVSEHDAWFDLIDRRITGMLLGVKP